MITKVISKEVPSSIQLDLSVWEADRLAQALQGSGFNDVAAKVRTQLRIAVQDFNTMKGV